jgi:hypothetical protein
MLAERRCWWCGTAAEVDTELPESGGLVRDDGTMDGSESWICTDNKACTERAATTRFAKFTPEMRERRSSWETP